MEYYIENILAGAGYPIIAASRFLLLFLACKNPKKQVASRAGNPIPIPTPRAILSEESTGERLYLESEPIEMTAAVVTNVETTWATDPLAYLVAKVDREVNVATGSC